MKVGCLQMNVARGDSRANLEKVRAFAPAARAGNVEVLLLPEMWSSGFAYRDLPRLAAETPALLSEIGRLAAESGMVIAGSMPEAEGGSVYNTLYVVDSEGRIRASYRKVHLFPPFKEELFLSRGSELVTVGLHGLSSGLAVCFDLRYPEVFRKLALRGARLMLVSAQWPVERLDHMRLLSRARAVENQVYLACANAAGRTGMTVFAGHSMIVGPEGEVLAEAGKGEELVTAEVDSRRVDEARSQVDLLSCRQETDEFLNLS